MTVLVPMAGPDPYRERGAAYCKALLDVGGEPLIQRVQANLACLGADRRVFVVRAEDDDRFYLGEVLRRLDPECLVLRAEAATAGAACTALLAVEHIDNEGELVIANGDQLFAYDLKLAVADFRARGLDAGTVVFDAVHPRWSYVRRDREGWVCEVAEKREISAEATVGVYNVRRGKDLLWAIDEMVARDLRVNGEFYVAPAYNLLIARGQKVAAYGVGAVGAGMYGLGVPEDLAEFERLQVSDRVFGPGLRG